MDKESYKRSIYIGDIDPNNKIIPVKLIRRQIIFDLLMWDKIILSDSQCLTDPRIRILMKGIDSSQDCIRYGIEDVDESLKGIECLIEAGLIEIAHRNTTQSSFVALWKDMIAKDTKDVPFLPETEDYARFLDTINQHKHIYLLSSMGERFKANLNSGLESGALKLSSFNDYEMELKRMFGEKKVLFRNLYDFLQEMRRNEKITLERYHEIYSYIYGCYSTNISAEIGCNISTEFKSIPLHLNLGGDENDLDIDLSAYRNFRPTWVFDSKVLDQISFEKLVRIRRFLNPIFDDGTLIDFHKGELRTENPNVVMDIWEDYTKKLERELGPYKDSSEKGTKAKLMMDSMVGPGVALIAGVIGATYPVIGEAISNFEILKNTLCVGMGICHYLRRREADVHVRDQKSFLLKYIKPNTKIITRIDNEVY